MTEPGEPCATDRERAPRSPGHARAGRRAPRHRAARLRPGCRLDAFGAAAQLGRPGRPGRESTLGVYFHGLQTGEQAYASTLAFTTFVLFQFFTVMNARFDTSTAFNGQLFDNRKLWLALAAVLVLQVVLVNWGPAQAAFDTVALNAGDWVLATGMAAMRVAAG